MGVFAFKLSNAASKSTRAKVLNLVEKPGNLRALARPPRSEQMTEIEFGEAAARAELPIRPTI
jgi:hypothetical protein